jgi:crotonobetainyl-CoA hydratase
MSDIVETERIGRVLRIVLNRPKVNAISRELGKAIHAAAKTLQDDPELVVGIITAKGERIFSAGWDFKEALRASEETPGDSAGFGEGGFAGITAYWGLKKPLIAAVNGPAVGGGFEIALAADVILMADHAYFELPEVQRGFLPDAGGIQRLPRRVPYNVAMEMILAGRRMSATEALSWGLVAKVMPSAQLQDQAVALASHIARGAPLALQALKEVMQAIDGRSLRDAMELSSAGSTSLPILNRMWKSEDAQEGPRAFLEKRVPQWRGQ